MKKSSATTFLFVILLSSSLASVLFCGLYIRNAIHLRDMQRNMASAQTYRALFGALINDTMEYSKKNAAIDPILEAAGFKAPKTAPAATAIKSGGK
jgi:hypothetical protein